MGKGGAQGCAERGNLALGREFGTGQPNREPVSMGGTMGSLYQPENVVQVLPHLCRAGAMSTALVHHG